MTAVRLIEGIELRWDQDRSLELSFLTVIPFFQVRERYAIGQRVQNQRRDLRFGSQLGLVTVDGCWTLELSSTWGEPYSGALRERFTAVDENGTLEVESTLCIGAKEEKATLIYQKMDAWVPRHKWNPLAMLNPHSFQI